jgi:hypothetical protein
MEIKTQQTLVTLLADLSKVAGDKTDALVASY